MRTLTRPMFNMGGPIKQGIMTGIREPYAGGGQAAGRAALVGNPVYPKTGGREHHVIPFLGLGAAAMRVLPAAYRGYKAAKYFKPGTLGKWGRFKSMFGVGRGLGAPMAEPGAGLGFRIGSFAKQNPFTTFGIASTVPQAGYGAYKVAKAAPETAWGATKRWADYVVPGDQSRWWKDKEPPTAVPLNPNLQATVKAAKELSKEKQNEFALKQREDRVQKYLKMMGYDRAKKTAIADALIDASKIVSDRGTLDLKNIGTDLINPIIQATSKRLDKPDQIREAVGLMATKAEIEKDLEDPSIKALRLEQLKELRGGFAKDIGDFILSAKGTKVKPKALERVARARAQEHGLDFKVVTDADIAGAGADADLETIIQSAVKDDGVYMIGDALIQVIDGVPKQIS
jgi:hypothetical protein